MTSIFSRRRWLQGSLLAGMSSMAASLAQEKPQKGPALPDGSQAKGMMTGEADRAVEKGLEYLASRRRADGSFGTSGYSGNVAITSLAALAFMAGGHQPQRGRFGKVVTGALKYILSQENREGNHPGFLHNPQASPHGPMYGHGFATLFLGEVQGMVPDKDLRVRVNDTLHRAVKLILDSQTQEGGWRYLPVPKDADISVTICQIMALRSARNAGIVVPKGRVDRCVEYVKRCQDKREGWFRYMAQGGGGSQMGFARTAAGVVALYTSGLYEGPEIEAGLRFLLQSKPSGIPFPRLDMHYFYGHYYAVQAMYTAGAAYWTEWFPAIRDELITKQRADGSWFDQVCAHYGTAMACIILQTPNNYLPIMQK
ncbi:MAG: prenyltransferase [Gemmataceae bacterium]|nr:prenyltransferase [Gemmataceae bacterium]